MYSNLFLRVIFIVLVGRYGRGEFCGFGVGRAVLLYLVCAVLLGCIYGYLVFGLKSDVMGGSLVGF